MSISNIITGTRPGLLHWNGGSTYLRDVVVAHVFAEAPAPSRADDLTLFTWNSRPKPGLMERSAERFGVACRAVGRGIDDREWPMVKLRLTCECLATVETPFVLAADAWDVLLVAPPAEILRRFREDYRCRLLFGTEKGKWPNLAWLNRFEEQIGWSPFRYLNSGSWIGETAYCREFFATCLAAAREGMAGRVPAGDERLIEKDDQGIIRTFFQQTYPETQLDVDCHLFQSLYLAGPDEVRWI